MGKCGRAFPGLHGHRAQARHARSTFCPAESALESAGVNFQQYPANLGLSLARCSLRPAARSQGTHVCDHAGMDKLPGYSKLDSAAQVENTVAELTKLVLEAVKNGKKKVKIELEVEVCVAVDAVPYTSYTGWELALCTVL